MCVSERQSSDCVPDVDQRSAHVPDLHGQSRSGSQEDHLGQVALLSVCGIETNTEEPGESLTD